MTREEPPQPDLRAALKAYDKQQITGPELADVVRASQERPSILQSDTPASQNAAEALDYPTLVNALRRLYTNGNYLGHRAEDDATAILAEIYAPLSPHNREADHG